MKLSLVTVALAASALVAACGSSPPPTARYASASASIRAAHEVGAQKVPDAQLHLQMAEDQLNNAKKMINDNDNDKAAWTLSRSQSDADLAVALAREAQTRAAADQVTQQLRQTQERRTP
jgi:hypothetical protein